MAKLRIKYGSMEIDYEGETDFDGNGIVDLIKEMSAKQPPSILQEDPAGNVRAPQNNIGGSSIKLHTSSIASKLGGNTAADLALAAAAHLQIVAGKDTFTRKELLEDMRGVPSRYKANMASNLTRTIETLVKTGRVHQIGNDSFSLSDPTMREIEGTLAS